MRHPFLRFFWASIANSPLLFLAALMATIVGGTYPIWAAIAPTWVHQAWLRGVLSLVVYWLLAYLFWRQSQKERDLPPPADYSARDAVRWIYNRSRWALWKGAEDGTALIAVGEMLRDAARQSRLHVWGRQKRSGQMASAPLTPIPPEYWDDATFDLTNCFIHDDHTPSSQTFISGERVYGDLTLNRTEVYSLWPPALYILWYFDRKRSERRP